MIFAGLRRKAKVGTKESRADLGNKFFYGIAVIPNTLLIKGPVKAGGVARPEVRLTGQGGIIVFVVPEAYRSGICTKSSIIRFKALLPPCRGR